jgi:hypothetical protein
MRIFKRRDYPHFIPPDELLSSEPRCWTKKQADAYFEWLMSVKEQRVEALLDFLGETVSHNKVEEALAVLGRKAADALKTGKFSSKDNLTNRGYALAADMGLLVAGLLVEANASIQWTILRKPKSDLFYNLPVLSGFGVVTLNPIGGSIAEAFGILRGDRTGEIWQEIYCFWLERATEQASKLSDA